jgi:hypothetical protein
MFRYGLGTNKKRRRGQQVIIEIGDAKIGSILWRWNGRRGTHLKEMGGGMRREEGGGTGQSHFGIFYNDTSLYRNT